ncbi:MAG TPA: STAS domain-containing protein, partial [Tepidisphaeraceae bacterium]|nr:STAS domain-containing protein [Tepidisphaeraceae bacterium]
AIWRHAAIWSRMTQANNNLGSDQGSGASSGQPSVPFIVQQVEKFTVVEFRSPSLMDPVQLETIGQSLYRLVDAEDRRKIVLDFEKVQYLSSQAIGIILTMNKKLSQLKNSQLVLCGVGPRLQELLKITRLDRLLTIRPTQREALKVGAV